MSSGPPAMPRRLPSRSARLCDAAVGRHHQGADAARIGDEGQRHAFAAQARDPQPVLDDAVTASPISATSAASLLGKAGHLEGEALLRVQPVVLDDVKLPADGAELQHADADRAEIGRLGGHGHDETAEPDSRRGPVPVHPSSLPSEPPLISPAFAAAVAQRRCRSAASSARAGRCCRPASGYDTTRIECGGAAIRLSSTPTRRSAVAASGRWGEGLARREQSVRCRPGSGGQGARGGGDGRTRGGGAPGGQAARGRDGAAGRAQGGRGDGRDQRHRHLPHRRVHALGRRSGGPLPGDSGPRGRGRRGRGRRGREVASRRATTSSRSTRPNAANASTACRARPTSARRSARPRARA